MNRTFTLILALMLGTIITNAQALFEQCQSGQNTQSLPQFKGQPTLIGGTALSVGAQYRYNYAVSQPYDMYAVIVVEEIVNAKLVKIDEADASDADKDGRFQPQIAPDLTKLTSNREGYIQFSIHFYQASTNQPSNISGLRFTHYDMDGGTYGSNGWFREIGMITGATGVQVSQVPASQLTNMGNIVSGGLTWNKFYGSTTEHAAVSSDPEVAMIAIYGGVNTIKFRMGYNFKYGGSSYNSPSFRQYAAKFGCVTFGAGGVLPVKLSYFGATAKSNHTVFTNWITEQETNFSHFELERSFNNKDFSTTAVILGAKSSNGTRNNYEYTDKSTELSTAKVAYYRLKQIDKDGAITYSEIRMVRFDAANTTEMQVSPNPFMEQVSLKFESENAGNAEIKLINMAGQVVNNNSTRINKGFNNISLNNLSSLSRGIYIVQVTVNGQVISKEKLVKN